MLTDQAENCTYRYHSSSYRRLLKIPVMAAVAVRKKVINIGCFSPKKFFYLLDQIKSNYIYWLHWKSEKTRTEPNELDELKCSKSLNQTIGYAHWHAFLYLHAPIKTLIYPIKNQKKKTELNELSELKCLKTPSQMSSYAHWYAFCICFLKHVSKYLFIYHI